ncbi:MAG: hypothetical protein Q9226_003647 [Calogaya cf. arnoldii]
MTIDMFIGENADGDQLQLEIFRRKYLQMLDPDEITYPMEWFIKLPTTQKWIYDHMFNPEKIPVSPYPPYAYRILKRLLSVLEAAMKDPEEDKAKNEMESIQEKRPVTYTAPVLGCNPPTVTILEAPNLLSSNGDTGNRTWDAALFLATFLFTNGRHLVQDKSVLELGAGLGFVSIFCGKHLGAKHVLVTDASEAVLCTAQQNAELNEIDNVVKTAVLEWGTPDSDQVFRSGSGAVSYDLVLGSDMLYEPSDFPALMSTLQDLFFNYPKAQMLISSAVRREETLETFIEACKENSFYVERVKIDPLPEKEQLGFFHSTFFEIQIYLITKRRQLMTNGREFLDLIIANSKKGSEGSVLQATALLPNMVGLYPNTHTISEITEPTHVRDILNHGYHWLRVSMSEHRNPLDIPLDQPCAIYHACCTITTPEFINFDLADGKGYWRIPFVFTEGPGLTAAMGLLMSAFDIKLSGRDWPLIGEGVGAGRGDLFVRALLFGEEFDAICRP